MVFYYNNTHALTSNLFKNEFYVKFQAQTCDYFEFCKNPNYSSITYYDNFYVTFSEEIPDLQTLQENFSVLKYRYSDSRNLYELDLNRINEMIPLTLTTECFVEKFITKKTKLNFSLILAQINLSLQLFDIITLSNNIFIILICYLI